MSIAAVIWHHTLSANSSLPLAAQGYQGVTLFFVISGFLIVTLILREQDVTGAVSVRNFYVRRVLRIWPLYFAVLMTYVLVVLLLEKDANARAQFFRNLPYFATFTSNIFSKLDSPRVIFYFAWSLAAEQQFYLVWPWIERWQKGRGGLIAAIAAVVAATVLSLAGYQVVSFVAAIGMGVVLAHLLHRPQSFAWMSRLFGQPGMVFATATSVLAALSAGSVLGPLQEPLLNLLLASLVAASVIPPFADLGERTYLRPVIWFGVVSYGVYLVHMLAVNIVRKVEGVAHIQSPVIDFLGGLLLAFAIATLSYHYYEKRFLALKKRFFVSRPPEYR